MSEKLDSTTTNSESRQRIVDALAELTAAKEAEWERK